MAERLKRVGMGEGGKERDSKSERGGEGRGNGGRGGGRTMERLREGEIERGVSRRKTRLVDSKSLGTGSYWKPYTIYIVEKGAEFARDL